jgi:hypothetical protein
MSRFRPILPALLALCLLVLGEAAPRADAGPLAPPAPGLARVWFLRGSISPNPAVQGFSPLIYVNGAAVGPMPQGNYFYRDFAPGTYRFTVQPFGLPTGQNTTLLLAPGSVTFLNVDWIQSWTQGYPEVSWNFNPNTFGIVPMNPQVALAYMPTMTYLGAR